MFHLQQGQKNAWKNTKKPQSKSNKPQRNTFIAATPLASCNFESWLLYLCVERERERLTWGRGLWRKLHQRQRILPLYVYAYIYFDAPLDYLVKSASSLTPLPLPPCMCVSVVRGRKREKWTERSKFFSGLAPLPPCVFVWERDRSGRRVRSLFCTWPFVVHMCQNRGK